MRFIFGLFAVFFKVRFIVWMVGIWFVWSTMGTFWTIIIAYGLAVYALFMWGPADRDGMAAGFTLAPTKGSPYALIAPAALVCLFPLAIIGGMLNGVPLDEQK